MTDNKLAEIKKAINVFRQHGMDCDVFLKAIATKRVSEMVASTVKAMQKQLHTDKTTSVEHR